MTNADWTVDGDLASEVDSAATDWRQGQIFDDVSIVRYADAARPLTRAAADAGSGPAAIRERLAKAVIVSQTCEIVRSCVVRPMVHVAEVVELTGPALGEALRGWRPQYVQVPWLGDSWFADLEVQGTIEKSVLLESNSPVHPTTAYDQMKFADGLGRHRSRFAFPDDLNPTMKPLVDRLREKAGKDTPQGRRIDEVREMRAKATPNWDAGEISVELILLVDPSTMPPQPADEEPPVEMLEQIADLDAQRLAEQLDSHALSPGQRNALWQRLGDAWCSRTKPCGRIRDVTTTVVPITEFSRADELECPELDLDYLSA